MGKPFSRFTGHILPNMPDIVQVIKSTTASLSWESNQVPKFCTEETGANSDWPTLILSTDTFEQYLSVPMIKNTVLLSFNLNLSFLRYFVKILGTFFRTNVQPNFWKRASKRPRKFAHKPGDRLLVTAVRIFRRGLLSWLVSSSSSVPDEANLPWYGKGPPCQFLAGGGCCKSVVS